MNLRNKHIIILGAGRSGQAAAALALREGAVVSVHDMASEIIGFSDEVQLVTNAKVETGRKSSCDLLVLSPGIDGETDFVRAYQENAGELIGEVELASRFYQGRIVAITGTNGKTTTTELVQRILSHSGTSCLACGNYGIPFSEIVMLDEPPVSVALEVSSFQLETITSFHPDVVIWLNFSADHMDRYPTLAAYKNAKLRVFKNLTENNRIIVRAGEDIGTQLADITTFSTEGNADYTLDSGWISQGDQKIIDLAETGLRGLHNAENAMAAYAACLSFGIDAQTASEALDKCAPPLHRCELVRTLDGVEYINDSKATNLHALDSALRSQGRPIVLIAGGKQKGLDYSELLPRLQQTTKTVIVFGEIADQLEITFSVIADQLPTIKVGDLEDAVFQARQVAKHGDTILFSPGTSSFDMFTGYEQRGDCFRQIVNQQN